MPQFDEYLNGKDDLGAAPASGDMIPVVDVSDTTEDAGGTLKRVSRSNLVAGLAPLASPALTGTPTAPTAAPGTDTTQVATTEFVTDAIASGTYPYPQVVNVHTGFTRPNAATPSSTVIVNNVYLLGAFRYAGSGVGNEMTWEVPLQAGTYVFGLVHRVGPDRGIYDIQLEGTTILTLDGYAAAEAEAFTEETGVVVPADGVYSVRFLMSSKNASSSNYYAAIQFFSFARTGA